MQGPASEVISIVLKATEVCQKETFVQQLAVGPVRFLVNDTVAEAVLVHAVALRREQRIEIITVPVVTGGLPNLARLVLGGTDVLASWSDPAPHVGLDQAGRTALSVLTSAAVAAAATDADDEARLAFIDFDQYIAVAVAVE